MTLVLKKPKMDNILFVLWVIVTYIPASLTHFFPYISQIGLMLRIAIFILMVYLNKGKLSVFTYTVLLFQIVFLVSDLVNSSLGTAHINYLLYNIIPCLMLDYAKKKGEQRQFLSYFLSVFRVYVLIHTVTRVIFPDGLYLGTALKVVPQYFLENDNAAMPYIYIFLIISMLYHLIYQDTHALFVFDVALSVFVTVYAWSGTGVIVVMVICIAYLISKYRITRNKLPLVIGITALIYFMIEFVVMIGSDSLLSSSLSIVGDFLGKDTLSFSGRTYIWMQSVEVIKEHFILGASFTEATQSISTISGMRSVGAHNQFLEYAVEGGILSIIAFIIVIVTGITHNKSDYVRSTEKGSRCISFLYLSIVAVMLGMMFEIYSSGWCLILLLGVCYHLGYEDSISTNV